jgi:hypothetical protein
LPADIDNRLHGGYGTFSCGRHYLHPSAGDVSGSEYPFDVGPLKPVNGQALPMIER